jgi:hypothetical protein
MQCSEIVVDNFAGGGDGDDEFESGTQENRQEIEGLGWHGRVEGLFEASA